MLDIIEVTDAPDPRMSRVVRDIFKKVCLVKSYDDGMRIAKENNLTCITSDF